MKTILKFLSIFVGVLWVFLFLAFITIIFFSDELAAVPALVDLRENLGLTRDMIENYLVYSAAILVPITLVILSADKHSGIFGLKKKSKTVIATQPVANNNSVQQAAITAKTAQEPVYKTIGLTQLKIKK